MGWNVQIEVQSLFVQIRFDSVVDNGYFHIHEVGFSRGGFTDPGQAVAIIHVIAELQPKSCVSNGVWICKPDPNDVIDESLVKKQLLRPAWDHRSFM